MTTTLQSSTLPLLVSDTNRVLICRLVDLDRWIENHAEAIGEALRFYWLAEADLLSKPIVKFHIAFDSKEEAMRFVHNEVGVEAINQHSGDQHWFMCPLPSFSVYVFFPCEP